jgi:predicted CopG family antitoxin
MKTIIVSDEAFAQLEEAKRNNAESISEVVLLAGIDSS